MNKKQIADHEYNPGINERVNSEISELPLKTRIEFLDWCLEHGHITEKDYKMLNYDLDSIIEEA